jgi:hypothetical protein
VLIAQEQIVFLAVGLGHDRRWICCALVLIQRPGFGGQQISTVNAGIATSVRAIQLVVSLPRMPENIETALATAGGLPRRGASASGRI